MTVGVIGTTAASASTPPSWSVVESPKPLHAAFARNAFSSVACIGKNSCFGVGYYVDTSNVQHALIERWKGAHWRVVTSPNAPGVSLNGVACTSVSNCFAVGVQNGRGRDRALIERWDGARWKLAAGANPAGVSASLSGVTCVSADNCFAVGRIESGVASALAEHWNGAKWSLVPVPMDGGTEPQMLSVACASATNCFAVGNSDYGRDDFAFVEQWNGSNWAIANSPRASNVTASLLSGVTCSGANNCFAVGRRFTGGSARTMIERWNGAEWTIVASPDPYNTVLLGVTCARSKSCIAVGERSPHRTRGHTFVASWDGTRWRGAVSPSPSDSVGSELLGASCTTAATCFAVGDYQQAGLMHHLIVSNVPQPG